MSELATILAHHNSLTELREHPADYDRYLGLVAVAISEAEADVVIGIPSMRAKVLSDMQADVRELRQRGLISADQAVIQKMHDGVYRFYDIPDQEKARSAKRLTVLEGIRKSETWDIASGVARLLRQGQPMQLITIEDQMPYPLTRSSLGLFTLNERTLVAKS